MFVSQLLPHGLDTPYFLNCRKKHKNINHYILSFLFAYWRIVPNQLKPDFLDIVFLAQPQHPLPGNGNNAKQSPAMVSPPQNVCPVCAIYYPPDFSQEDFKGHVQSHFTD